MGSEILFHDIIIFFLYNAVTVASRIFYFSILFLVRVTNVLKTETKSYFVVCKRIIFYYE